MNINRQPAVTWLMIDIKHKTDRVLVEFDIKHQPGTVLVDI